MTLNPKPLNDGESHATVELRRRDLTYSAFKCNISNVKPFPENTSPPGMFPVAFRPNCEPRGGKQALPRSWQTSAGCERVDIQSVSLSLPASLLTIELERKITYACNYCNHRQKIIANQYPFRETWKKTLQLWDAGGEASRSFSWSIEHKHPAFQTDYRLHGNIFHCSSSFNHSAAFNLP